MPDHSSGLGGDFRLRIRRMFDDARTNVKNPPGGPFVWGFNMRFRPDGRPSVEEFGNVSSQGVLGYMEPATDVIERADSVSVVIELPGVAKEEIDLRASVESLYLSVNSSFRKYEKDVRFSCRVQPETTQARYNNGVLEVTLRRADESLPGGKKVRVQ
jgi:HSP20 family protein